MPDFALDSRLAADTRVVADWALCRILLMEDARFPWLILVPRVPGAREAHRLDPADRSTLSAEVTRATAALEAATGAAKMNVAALGNVVPQLHVHVIARREEDAAWPAPVWGLAGRKPYEADARDALLRSFETALTSEP